MKKKVLSILLVLITVLTAFPLTALFSFAADKNGFINENGKTYYYKNNVMETGWETITDDKGVEKKYHFLSDGVMEIGFTKITNKKGATYTYYFGKDGAMRTGWQSITADNGKTYKYYFKNDGVMITGWKEIKDSNGKKHWYYFFSDGRMATGWQKIKNSKGKEIWYYFSDKGVMTTGWKKIKNSKGKEYWYYFLDSGKMVTGWKKIKDSKGNKYWYYFLDSGRMITGWKKIKTSDGNKNWYYFVKSGRMADDWKKIDGKWYFFDRSGVYIPGFNNVYASFSCNYVYDPDRTNNLRVASNYISGTILQPGDVFDFNEIVGPRTYARGFKDAGVFVGQDIAQGVGGGICHVSTTVFNAALRANMQILERHQHSMKVAYVPAGMDATIYQNTCNLRFKNTTGKTIKITMSVKDGVISCEMLTSDYCKPPKIKLDVTRSGDTYTLKRYADGVCNYTTKSTY